MQISISCRTLPVVVVLVIFCLMCPLSDATVNGQEAPAVPQGAGDINICAYHFRDSIGIFIYGPEKMEKERIRVAISSYPVQPAGYPLFLNIDIYRIGAGDQLKEDDPRQKLILSRHVITFLPIDKDKFTQILSEDRTYINLQFMKVPVSEDVIMKHVESVHEYTFTIPAEEYDDYLVPEVLKKNESGEYKITMRPTQTLKTIPKQIIKK